MYLEKLAVLCSKWSVITYELLSVLKWNVTLSGS